MLHEDRKPGIYFIYLFGGGLLLPEQYLAETGP